MENLETKIIDLGIGRNYIRDWTLVDAIREITQNCIDEGDYKIKYDYETLTLINNNVTLGLDKLVLGETTKYNDNTKIGKFGEGLKLALLVLVRNGNNVTIYNGNKIWTPYIEKSEIFNVETLHIKITETDNYQDLTFKIEMDDCVLEELSFSNLILRKEILGGYDLDYLETDYGKIIFDDEFCGRIYVEGLYVQTDTNMRYGFDFYSEYIKLDRDRKVINIYELRAIVAKTILKSKEINIVFDCLKDSDFSEEISNNIGTLGQIEIEEFKELYAKEKRIDFSKKVVLVTSEVYDFLKTFKQEDLEYEYKKEDDDNVREVINNANDLEDLYESIMADYDKWDETKNEIPNKLKDFNNSDYKYALAFFNKYKSYMTPEEITGYKSKILSSCFSWYHKNIIDKIDKDKVTFEDITLDNILL